MGQEAMQLGLLHARPNEQSQKEALVDQEQQKRD
jgi:hypothetical protein